MNVKVKKQAIMNLNLASHPTRNRRLFFMFLISLGVLFFIISIAGGSLYVNFREKVSVMRASLDEIEGENERLQREMIGYTSQLDKYSQTHQKKIDLINSMIYKKSFSWVKLLSTLEEVLPASCFIVTLSFAYEGEKSMGVRLRVAAPGLSAYMQLLKGLAAADFDQIRLISETETPNGFILYDMTIRYERNI